MATSGTYFINGPDLTTATAVFTDSALSVCAPDGFYSDGTVVREQVGCVLLPQVPCPSCLASCDTNISVGGGQGIYYLDTNTGTNTGAIIVRFNPYGIPEGILVQLGPNQYNGMSSQNFGWLQGFGSHTYVGDGASSCIFPLPFSVTLNEFAFQSGSFVSLGTTIPMTINSGQLDLTSGAPGICTMVIPKTSNAYTLLETELVGPCTSASFDIQIECPALLPTWLGSTTAATSGGACLETANQTYYYVHVNGSGGVLGLYDLVFSDPNGQNKLPAGYYNTGSMSMTYNWVQVDSNGVVIGFGVCAPSQFYIVEMCYSGEQRVISASGSLNIGDFVNLVGFPDCIWEVLSAGTAPATATLSGISEVNCVAQCLEWIVENTTGEAQNLDVQVCSDLPEPTAPILYIIPPFATETICARYISFAPAGVNVTFSDCQCGGEDNYLVESCTNPSLQVVVSSSTALTIGQLVKISGYGDCWFSVVSVSVDPAVQVVTFINTDPEFDCTDVCGYYQLCNNTEGEDGIAFANCDGSPSFLSIPPGQCVFVCARANSFEVSNIDVNFISCDCEATGFNYFVQRCYTNDLEIISSTSPLIIGSLVTLSEYPGCVWEIMSSTTSVPTATFVALTDNCESQCSTWTLTNSSGSSENVGYTDCAGVSQIVTLAPTETQNVCARSIDAIPFGVTFTLVECQCPS